jgi:hypothetical protein
LKILINYSDIFYTNSQKKNTLSGLEVAGFDKVIEYHKSDLDNSFIVKNNHILSQSRGAGYWLWKPYIILKTLNEINYGDILFYCDSGAEFKKKIDELIPIMDSDQKQILVFELIGHNNVTWTKRDCFILTDSDLPEIVYQKQILAGYLIMRKNEFTIKFIKEWLEYCQDYRCLTDSPNEIGLPNYNEFIDHRHDQSILSILSRKHQLNNISDISQWGRNSINHIEIINLHRDNN